MGHGHRRGGNCQHNLGRSTKASLVLPHLSQGAQTLFRLILAEWKIHVCTDSYDVIDVGESYAVYIHRALLLMQEEKKEPRNVGQYIHI